MDRFIVCQHFFEKILHKSLKSNMDRFIDMIQVQGKKYNKSLKSNMDRFIECKITNQEYMSYLFKIQYG